MQGAWRMGIEKESVCTSNGSLRELLKSFGQLSTVVSAERSSLYKYHLCWHLRCCILRSCLSSHSRCVLISSVPDILEIWGADKERRCREWKRLICGFFYQREQAKEKPPVNECHFVPGLMGGMLVGPPSILFYLVLVTTLWGWLYPPLSTDEEAKAQGNLAN